MGLIPDGVTGIFCLSVQFFNSCRRLPETKRHSSLFLHWSGSKFLVVMAVCTPSIHVFLGCPLFLLSRGIQSIINFGILSSGILLMWPYHCSLFCSVISMMSGFTGIFHWLNLYGPGIDSTSNRNKYQEYFLGDTCGRCIGLTTLSPSCANCLEI